MRILLVSDPPPADPLMVALRGAGYAVDAVTHTSDLLYHARSIPYSLLLVDVADPLAVFRGLRRGQCSQPILVMSGDCRIDERVQALDVGADDYLVKPVDHAELLARLRALLRRPAELVAPVLRTGNTEFDEAKARVSCACQPVDLRLGERRLLAPLRGSPSARSACEGRLTDSYARQCRRSDVCGHQARGGRRAAKAALGSKP